VAGYRGDFLLGFSVPDAPAFDEWALLERERLRLLVIDLLQRLAEDALARQAYDEGAGYTRRSLALDNWREEAYRLLMRLLALAGKRSDALAQFEQCRRLLAENLGPGYYRPLRGYQSQRARGAHARQARRSRVRRPPRLALSAERKTLGPSAKTHLRLAESVSTSEQGL